MRKGCNQQWLQCGPGLGPEGVGRQLQREAMTQCFELESAFWTGSQVGCGLWAEVPGVTPASSSGLGQGQQSSGLMVQVLGWDSGEQL